MERPQASGGRAVIGLDDGADEPVALPAGEGEQLIALAVAHRCGPVAVEPLAVGLDGQCDPGPGEVDDDRPRLAGHDDRMVLHRVRDSGEGADREEVHLRPRPRDPGLVGEQRRQLPNPRSPRALGDELGKATALEQPERLSGDEENLEVSGLAGGREVDQDPVGRDARNARDPPPVPGVDEGPMDDDALATAAGSTRNGDLRDERPVLQEPLKDRRGFVTEEGVRPTGENRTEPDLVTRQRGRGKRIDAVMDAVQSAGVGTAANRACTQSSLMKLVKAD